LWTGGNNNPARKKGAEALADEIIKWREKNPEEPIRLVGHSHGGNVAILLEYCDSQQKHKKWADL